MVKITYCLNMVRLNRLLGYFLANFLAFIRKSGTELDFSARIFTVLDWSYAAQKIGRPATYGIAACTTGGVGVEKNQRLGVIGSPKYAEKQGILRDFRREDKLPSSPRSLTKKFMLDVGSHRNLVGKSCEKSKFW